MDKKMEYSVLMSVYCKENPNFLRESIESIYNQTVPTNDFVLVCDGPLTEGLNKVIDEAKEQFQHRMQVVRLEKNLGLGQALNEGLAKCKNSIVARMDSDDVSDRERMSKILREYDKNPSLGIVGSNIQEFFVDWRNSSGERKVPSQYEDILIYSRKRSPFNHPAVTFKKENVVACGGYNEKYHFFEDYYLWIRLLKNGVLAKNLSENLVYMRTSPDQIARRGGNQYAKDLLRFHFWMKEVGWIDWKTIISSTIPHVVVSLIPSTLRGIIYKGMRKFM